MALAIRTSVTFVTFCLISVLLIPSDLVGARSSRRRPEKFVVQPSEIHGMYQEEFKCEKMEIKECQGIGYNYTYMPNRLGNERQNEAAMVLTSYKPLLQSNCSSQLLFFLCAVHAPMCSEQAKTVIGPCESMCRAVERTCRPVMKSFDFEWPDSLNCSNFPADNQPPTLCMAGHENQKPGEKNDLPQDIHCKPPQMKLTKDDRCVWKCGYEQGMFSVEEKNFSDRWMGVWAVLCFLSTIFTVLTFLIDASRFKYPERSIIFLAICYNIYSTSFILRLLVGRENISCERNIHGDMFLIQEGLGNTGCAIIFLLSYFFGMASYLWWVILTITWFLAAGMKWSHEAIEKHNSYFHLAAWSIPSIKVVVILIMRHVDGDELTGLCYVGNQDINALTGFVLAPIFTYLVIGTSFLFAGFVSLFRIKSYMKREGSKTDKLERLMVKIGIFSVLYIVPAAIVIGCYFYEHSNKKLWEETGEVNPSASIYHLRILMQLIIGVFTGFWVWSRKTMLTWRKCSQSLLVYNQQPAVEAYPRAHEARDHPVQSQRRISGHSSATTGTDSSRSPKGRFVAEGLYAIAVLPPNGDVTDSQSLVGGRNKGFKVDKSEAMQQPLLSLTTNRAEGSVSRENELLRTSTAQHGIR
uniref:Fz4 frizzled receptor n=1 Tax=Phallusia mammillata TaxID=59560 RepID=A0A6F9DE14_9ASCI|nr:Fz4 frizzled receptor [Phallusia mammillata]